VFYVREHFTNAKLSTQLFIKHHSYSSVFRLDMFSHLQAVYADCKIGIKACILYIYCLSVAHHIKPKHVAVIVIFNCNM
jgi:hypothetical protein